MDSVSRETRSRIMAAIHGSNTGPELLVRRALFARGFRFRVNCKDLPGHPDLKLTKHRAVVFVHGCFWHGHDCRYYRLPSSNVDFWAAKIAKNRERDLRNVRELREAGWRICIVWECAARLAAAGKDQGKLFDRIGSWLAGEKAFVEYFGAAAVNGSPRDGRSRPVGINADAALFAAEREPGYRRSPGNKG